MWSVIESSKYFKIAIIMAKPETSADRRIPTERQAPCPNRLLNPLKNTGTLQTFKLFMRLVDWRSIRLRRQACAVCGHSTMIKFSESEHAVRCLNCRANPSAMCMAAVLEDLEPALDQRHVYELSSRGPLFRYLQSHCRQFTFSEFFEDVPPGGNKDGVPCQDVQGLTFSDRSFELCTSTDVFEHVPDDGRAFREVSRVLEPGGHLVFTVPLDTGSDTVERAFMAEGRIEHLLPPEYHHDHLSGLDKVLCFRNYGRDIVDRLEDAGFSEARIVPPNPGLYWGYGRHVVVARR